MTIRPLTEQGTSDAAQVERISRVWQARLNVALSQVPLWSQPYPREGAW